MGSSEKKRKFDLLIAGMGLSGLSLAAHLPPGIRALVIEAKNGIGWRPCGGVMLDKAANHPWVAPQKDIFASVPDKICARISDHQGRGEKRFENELMNIDKNALLNLFLQRIPAGVEIRFGTRLAGIRADGAGFEVSLLSAKGQGAVTVDRMVGADGVNSAVRLHFLPRLDVRKYYAMQVKARSRGQDPFFNIIVDPDVTEFYAWKVPKKGHHIVGFATEQKDGMPGRLGTLLERTGCTALEKPHGTVLGRYWPEREDTPGLPPNVYLVGEAGGHIGYFSDGMGWALRGAEFVSAVLNEDGAQRRYADFQREMSADLKKQHGLFKGFLESSAGRRKMFLMMKLYRRFPDF